jgi:hypothetical protein
MCLVESADKRIAKSPAAQEALAALELPPSEEEEDEDEDGEDRDREMEEEEEAEPETDEDKDELTRSPTLSDQEDALCATPSKRKKGEPVPEMLAPPRKKQRTQTHAPAAAGPSGAHETEPSVRVYLLHACLDVGVHVELTDPPRRTLNRRTTKIWTSRKHGNVSANVQSGVKV